MLKFITVFLACAAVAAARHPSWTPESQGWVRTAAPVDSTAYLSVGLHLEDAAGLAKFVAQVSDPNSPSYAQYLTIEQIAALYGPSASKVNAVARWFETNGATSVEVSQSRDMMWVAIPHSALTRLVGGVTFHTFTHPVSKRSIIRTTDVVAWKWPSSVGDAVEIVTGVSDFLDSPLERKGVQKMQARSASEAVDVTPEVMRCQGSEHVMEVEVLPYCPDGTPADLSKGGATCSGTVSIKSLVLTAVPRAGKPIHEQYAVGDMINAGSSLFTPAVPIPAYRRLNVSITTFFSNGLVATGYLPNEWSPSPWVDPRVIHAQYGVPLGTRGTHPNNSQAVASFEGQYINLDTDLTQFFHDIGMPYVEPTIKGYNNLTLSAAGGEASLDIQYIMGVGAGVPSTFWSVNGPGPAVGDTAYILTWAYLVGNDTSAPLVTSLSYGDTEGGYYNKFGDFSYLNRMDLELSKMAARGLTVLAGSGDAGSTNVGEAGNDISPTDPDCSKCRPFYPSNSRYVTSVSATFLTPNAVPACELSITGSNVPVTCTQVGERAVGVSSGIRWTTGGGFSSYTPQQPWQADAVNNYLKTYSQPPSAFFNASGRGYPDVATIGHNLLLRWAGRLVPVDGTSASGPVMAGLVSLMNDARLHAGKPPVGLLAPAMYAAAAAKPSSFVDVVTGDNKDGDLQGRGSKFPTFCPNGFFATPGWDAVTGLGSPYFPALLDYVMSR